MPLDETDIQPQLDRRRPAQSKLTTTRPKRQNTGYAVSADGKE
jgi:chorismate synthase